MSDFNSSLPVRTETNGDVVGRLVDGVTNTQYLSIDAAGLIGSKLYDAAGTGLTSQLNGAQQALDVMDQSNGPVTPGTAAAFSSLIGGQFNTVLPTLTNGQQAALQVDANGRLLTSTNNFPTTVDTDYGVVGANTIRTAAQIGNATGAADFNAGATGAQTLRVEANQGAPGTAANGWFVKITDGTNDAVVSASGELSVLATAQPGVDIGDVTVNNGAGAAAVNIQDGGNSITVDGTVSASNFPATVDTNYGTVGANTIRTAAQIGNATGAADFDFGASSAQTLRVASLIGNATGAADFNAGATGAQTLRVEANQGAPNSLANAWPTSITDGTDTLAVNTDGSINVVIADATPGTPVNDYNTAAAVASAATSNHDYTVTAGKTLYLNQIEASGTGKMKIEVQVETGVATGTFNTRWVQFNSTANTNMTIHIDNNVIVAAGVRVRIIRTNRDNQSQDLYSTISGYELP